MEPFQIDANALISKYEQELAQQTRRALVAETALAAEQEAHASSEAARVAAEARVLLLERRLDEPPIEEETTP